MKIIDLVLNLFFPPKCLFCDELLTSGEDTVCEVCRLGMEDFSKEWKVPYLHKWVSLWYYEETIRQSVLRYKFGGARCYAPIYGKYMAERLRNSELVQGDFVLSWVPISPKRKWKRGYDQGQLLAKALGKELGITPVRTLRKIRDTPAQSGIHDPAKRRANVLGAYQVVNTERIAGKRVLLLDDVLTTGATVGECAKMLLLAKADTVDGAFLAASR